MKNLKIAIIVVVVILLTPTLLYFYENKSPYNTPTPESVGRLYCKRGMDIHLFPPKYRRGISGIISIFTIKRAFESDEDVLKISENVPCNILNVEYKSRDRAIVSVQFLPCQGKKCDFTPPPTILKVVKLEGEWFYDY